MRTVEISICADIIRSCLVSITVAEDSSSRWKIRKACKKTYLTLSRKSQYNRVWSIPHSTSVAKSDFNLHCFSRIQIFNCPISTYSGSNLCLAFLASPRLSRAQFCNRNMSHEVFEQEPQSPIEERVRRRCPVANPVQMRKEWCRRLTK